LPPCAKVENRVNVPPEFPRDIPLPPGTVLTASRHTERGIVLEGVIPMERSQAVRFFLQKFTAGGFVVGRGEAEEEEAEAPFRGKGLLGFFKIRNIRDCPNALWLMINVQTMSPRPPVSPSVAPSASISPAGSASP